MAGVSFHSLLVFNIRVLRILYWNCRGAGSQRFCNILNDLIRIHRVDLVFIAEPRINGDRVEEIAKKLSLCCIQRIEATGRSGGLWMLAKDGTFKFEILIVGTHFIHMSLEGEGQNPTYCIAVYIYPHTARKNLCFENLKTIARNMNGPWFLIGDFNEILGEEEKKGGVPVENHRCLRFRKWANECKLINLEVE